MAFRFRWQRAVAIGLPLVSAALMLSLVQGCSKDSPKDSGPGGNKGRLQNETHTAWIVDENPVTGTPDLLVAVDPLPPSVQNGNYEAAARAWIDQHKDIFKLTDIKAQLITTDVIVAHNKTAHVRFQQREGGLRVENAIIAVHFRADGSIAMINQTLVPDANKAVGSPAINEAQAIATAEAKIHTDIPDYTSATLEAPATPKLILSGQGASATLAWRFVMNGRTPTSIYGQNFLVDAKTGALIEALSSILDIDAKGAGVLGDVKDFEASRTLLGLGDYEMTAGNGFFSGVTTIQTVDANQANKTVHSPKSDEWDVVTVGAGNAVDSHVYTIGSDHYFRDFHGWSSYDGKGSKITVYAHDNGMVNNAWWDTKGGLHFSDGMAATKGDLLPLSASPDVVGHELMHGITQHTAGLTYQGQSGALNESISDIFGSYVEAEVNAGSMYEINDRGGRVFRDMSHPTLKGQPDNMKDLRAAGQAPTKANDYGGVHGNSGIPNNAWYLMANGGINDTSKIPVNQSIGLDGARTLWWATIRYMLSSGSQFDQTARTQTAWGMLMGQSVEAVGCAWVATGVLTNKYVLDTYKVRCYCETDDGGVQQPEDMKCCEQGKVADECCKPCDEAGTPDGGPVDPPGDPKQPDLYDSCAGRADGVYCSQLATYGAIVCEGETIALGIQCENERKCIGPNGPGTQVQCEGGANLPPQPAADGGNVPVADSCEGRGDGVYCSSLAPYSAYECQGGTIAGGQQCADDKKCTGPNGPGKTVVCQ